MSFLKFPKFPNRSKYALHLQSLADQQNGPDVGSTSNGRASKKHKLDGAVVPPQQAANKTSTPNTAGTSNGAATTTPGLPSGLSQNINGSEVAGRKARDEFVSRTLSSVASGIEGTRNNGAPRASAPAPQGLDDEDDEMAEQSNSDDEIQGETPAETAYLRRLKDLYSKQPDKATQKALLAVLEELSREAEQEGRPGKRRKRRANSDTPWDQNEKYVCTDSPQRREKQRVALSGYIRLILGELLKLKDNKSALPHGPPPEVAAPTAAAFYIKWSESEKSEFNAIAARIVALQVVADFPSLCNLDEIHDMVTSHIKYLRARYRRQTMPEYIAKEAQRLRSSSANTRRRTLYGHRLRIINAVPALARHGRLIETLGLEGTSSDEEDLTRGVRGIYVVKRRKQLSSKVTHLKRQLDLAYSIHFKRPGSKGNQLRKRVDTDLVSNRRLKVPGLPLSCMDPGWVAGLTDVQKEMYEFRDMQYDFTFPQELLESPEGL
ncbi:hypothetical protein FRC06_003328 [Ceratobasidium sp. 370]|nr:hypothetical protein FRC06_003328 [Ceratobasidium sp. 370]